MSPIIGSWPMLSFLTNLVHEVSGGDNTIMMSKMLSPKSNQFVASYGSTLRAIFDFSNRYFNDDFDLNCFFNRWSFNKIF